MTTLTIHHVNDGTTARLRQLAASHGHSLEEEVHYILIRAADQCEQKGPGTQIARCFAEIGGV